MKTNIFITLSYLAATCFVGCGGGATDKPELAKVNGLLVKNGQPVANAEIQFSPATAGGPSRAVTDDEGRFDLKYTGSESGAVVGMHKVRVTVYGKRGPVEVEGELGPPLEPPKEYELGQHQVAQDGSDIMLNIPTS